MGLARQSVQRSIDLPAEKGLVMFDLNPHHQRSRLASLTDAGRTAISAVKSRIRPIDNNLAEMIGEDRMAVALAVLDEMREIMTVMQSHLDQGKHEEAA